MDIRELRIGNRVMYNGYECEVYSLHMPEPYEDKRFDGKQLVGLSIDGLITVPAKEVCAMRTTEDRLIKLGFSANIIPENGHFRFYDKGHVRINGDGIYFWFHGSAVNEIHKVQNLYWCLCSEELNVNP